ncbi:hypothetical protein AB0D49_25795 [Streptomyces sp. NPDC048290]|uniref:hypothetical protein n=1 Tax=Streptomyces sp. NPDC048290 TaxID=3155811 RepID=UPI00342A7AE6
MPTVRHMTDRFGPTLGERIGTYPVAGQAGAVLQALRRILVGFLGTLLVLLVFRRPEGALTSGAILATVLLVVYGLRLAWGRLAARLGIRRCHLFTGGLVVTGLLGGVREVVAWPQVTVVNQSATVSLWLTFHRIELVRGWTAPPVTLLALGRAPALASDLRRVVTGE